MTKQLYIDKTSHTRMNTGEMNIADCCLMDLASQLQLPPLEFYKCNTNDNH